jgi:hypothetical protein
LDASSTFNLLRALHSVLLFGKIEMPEEFQHAPVLAHYHRVEGPNPVVTRHVDQTPGQGYPYPTALPAILDDGRVLGLLFARFAVVAHNCDDLVRIVGVYGDESEVICTVGVGEVLGLFFGELRKGPEEAQVDRPLATTSEEPL